MVERERGREKLQMREGADAALLATVPERD